MKIERYKIGNLISKIVLDYPKVNFEIELRGNITIIEGNSSTGKSFFIKTLKKYCVKNNLILLSKYGISNIKFLDNLNLNSNTVDEIKNLKNSLIIIDNADLLLSFDDKLLKFISYDSENQYIIMSRGAVNLPVSPNHYCELRNDGKRIYTFYYYNVLGWM